MTPHPWTSCSSSLSFPSFPFSTTSHRPQQVSSPPSWTFSPSYSSCSWPLPLRWSPPPLRPPSVFASSTCLRHHSPPSISPSCPSSISYFSPPSLLTPRCSLPWLPPYPSCSSFPSSLSSRIFLRQEPTRAPSLFWTSCPFWMTLKSRW